MTAPSVKRKLTTILSADVAGYSRLMGEDEHLEMFEHTEAAKAAVAKAKSEADARARHAVAAE